ncbi:hypothetical protein, partial [Dolichospermum circinale]|uniref:hypothetical protein n=1 Tax=Dolichospermum circinale TaxID=109265 RepID=UPI001E649627
DCRAENPYPWNVSTRVVNHAYLIVGNVYYVLFRHTILKSNYSLEYKYISNILKDIHLNSVLN